MSRMTDSGVPAVAICLAHYILPVGTNRPRTRGSILQCLAVYRRHCNLGHSGGPPLALASGSQATRQVLAKHIARSLQEPDGHRAAGARELGPPRTVGGYPVSKVPSAVATAGVGAASRTPLMAYFERKTARWRRL